MKYIYLIIFCILLLFVVFRPLNHDETYYLISGNIFLSEGKIPYTDFIFHQMPLAIFAYIPVSVLGFWGLPLGRLLSCLFLLASFLILLKAFAGKFSQKQILIFTILFWFNLFLIDWGVTIKIYPLSILLVSGGVYFYLKYLDGISPAMNLFWASLCFSLLIFTKIAFAANFAVLVIYTCYNLFSGKTKLKLIAVLCSLLLPLIICTLLFFAVFGTNFERLYFNLFEINILYKYLTAFWEDVFTYLMFFILPQNFILLILVIFSFYRTDKIKVFLLLNIIAFLIINLTTRLLIEYNTTILPLMIILAVMGFDAFVEKGGRFFKNIPVQRFAAILLIVYCITGPLSLYHIKQYISSGKLPLNPVELYYFTEKINSLPGKTALVSWEGLTIFSTKETLHKDNYAISYVSDFIDKNTKAKYNLFIREDYKKLVNDARADIIVFDNANGSHLSELDDNIRINYKEAFEYNYITVFERK